MFQSATEEVMFNTSKIEVHLDQTDLQKTTFVQSELISTYKRLIAKTMKDCGKSEKLNGMPMKFETLNGNLSFEMKKNFGFGLLLS